MLHPIRAGGLLTGNDPPFILSRASSPALVGFFYVLFGSFQGGTYTSMLALLSRHFATDQDSLVLGFWFGGIDFGNILGFFVCTCFIYYL